MASHASFFGLKRSVVLAALLLGGCSSAQPIVAADGGDEVSSSTTASTAVESTTTPYVADEPATTPSVADEPTTTADSADTAESDYPWEESIGEAALSLAAIAALQDTPTEAGSGDLALADLDDTDCPLGDFGSGENSNGWLAEDGGSIMCFGESETDMVSDGSVLAITMLPFSLAEVLADGFGVTDVESESAAVSFGPGEIVSLCGSTACVASWTVPGLQVLVVDLNNPEPAATEEFLRANVQAALDGAGSFDLTRLA